MERIKWSSPSALPFTESPVEPCQQQIPWGTKITTLNRMADATAQKAIVMADAQDGPRGVAPLELSNKVLPTGEAVVDIGGELDIATAEAAVRYVRQVIDRHHKLVIVDLTGLRFCDARGLNALLRMAGYAERAGCPFRLASPSPSLVKIMRITGLDRRFLPATDEGQPHP
jgi:anti-sigma B factor antagonist